MVDYSLFLVITVNYRSVVFILLILLYHIQQGSTSSVPSVTPASIAAPPTSRAAHAAPPAPGPTSTPGASAPGPSVEAPALGPPPTASRFKPPWKSAQAETSTGTVIEAKRGRKRAASSVPSYSYFTCSGNN
jgi:hypothetical protein